MSPTIDADPYPWPYGGVLDPQVTALPCDDWQVDFCGPGGYVDRMGYDLSLTRAGLEPTARVLDAMRDWGALVVHTREPSRGPVRSARERAVAVAAHRGGDRRPRSVRTDPDARRRGIECLLLSDCTGATDPGNHEAALKMVTMQGGVFGAVAASGAFRALLGGAV